MRRPNKALLIDSAACEIRPVTYTGLEGLKELVGGYIEILPAQLPNGQVIFVDEEGLFKPQRHFFMFKGYDQPIAGNGVLVGREINDRGDTAVPSITPKALAPFIRWLTRVQVDAWAKANASEPFATITMIDPDGTMGEPEIIARVGSLFRDMPRPRDEEEDKP